MTTATSDTQNYANQRAMSANSGSGRLWSCAATIWWLGLRRLGYQLGANWGESHRLLLNHTWPTVALLTWPIVALLTFAAVWPEFFLPACIGSGTPAAAGTVGQNALSDLPLYAGRNHSTAASRGASSHSVHFRIQAMNARTCFRLKPSGRIDCGICCRRFCLRPRISQRWKMGFRISAGLADHHRRGNEPWFTSVCGLTGHGVASALRICPPDP